MGNSILTPTVIAREALKRLKNNLVMARRVHRAYKDEFKSIGSTVTIPRPIRYDVTDGATLSKQDVQEGDISLTVDKRKHVAFGFSSQDLTMDPVSFGSKFIEPAVSQLAHKVDMDLLALYDEVPDWAGTPGQDINSYADFAKGCERLDLRGVPEGDRSAVLSVSDTWALLGSQTELSAGESIVKDAYRRARLGEVAGVELFKSQQVRSHTVGTYISGGTCTDAGSAYSAVKSGMTQSITIASAGANKTFAEGDVITLSGVYDVNPNTKDALPHLKQFTVRAAASSDGSGDGTLTIYPAIIISGPYQNASAAPSAASIVRVGTASTAYRQNMVFHKNAFALVSCPLITDPSMPWSARATDKDTGLSIRVVRDYDSTNDEIVTRLDILYGCKAIYPELASRLSGTV
jgi:hypothetical protein